MSVDIKVTDAACTYIKKKIEKEKGIGFRLSVKKTGCSGYSYSPSIVNKMIATDISIKKNGVSIFIDPTWSHLLNGLQVDYVEEEKLGIKQKRLLFINPNEATRCGCGESFHIEKEEE